MLYLGVFDRVVFFLTLSTKDKHKVVSSVLTVAALRIAIIQYVKDNEHRIPFPNLAPSVAVLAVK